MMIKTKYALVLSSKNSSWVSCQSIVSNLHNSYQIALEGKEYQTFHLAQDANLFECFQVATQVEKYQATEIIFIDHKPSIANFIKSLLKKYEERPLPKLTIHVYGDFILGLGDWVGLDRQLSKTAMTFLCASKKQKTILESLFKSKSNHLIKVTPFPVDKKKYSFDVKIRNTSRREYNILDNEFVFVYTGRISLQKNVIELIHSYLSAKKAIKSKTKLLLAGPFDDMGAPYLGLKSNVGSYQQQIVNLLEDIDKNNSVEYIGNLNHDSLLKLYNASDCFVSISAHNDEDYGMSPAEAKCCGLPLILSDWGGYSSFYEQEDENACELVPVSIIEKKIAIDLSLLKKKMILKAIVKYSDDYRQELSNRSHSNYSIESISDKIKELTQQPGDFISSYDDKFYRAASTITKNAKAPFSGDIGKFSDFYELLYSPYWESTRK